MRNFLLYIDAGTGALLINMILALFASIAYYFRSLFFWIFNFKKPKNKKIYELSLFSEGEQYSATFEPIIDSLIQNKIKFNYFTMSYKDSALLIDNEYINSKYIGKGSLGFYRFSKIISKFLITTTPNIGNKGFVLKKPKKVSNLIHVYHSIIGLPHYKTGALDNYDSVIIGGNYQIDPIRTIEKIRNLNKKKIYKLGIPYLDSLYSKKEKIYSKNKTILIASSWGMKGCFRIYGTDFIDELSELGYDIILRPHPQSYKSEPDFIKKVKSRFKKRKNILWDDLTSPSNSMNKSHILISDSSSIRFDFAFIYERPVITLKIDKEHMIGFENQYFKSPWEDNAEKIIGQTITISELNQLSEIITININNFNPEKIKKLKDETFYYFGESGKSISKLFYK